MVEFRKRIFDEMITEMNHIILEESKSKKEDKDNSGKVKLECIQRI